SDLMSGGLRKKEDYLQKLSLLSMSGAAAPIFYAFIRLFMSGCVCRRRGSVMFMRTSRAWQRAQLSGSPNFFQSLLALPRTPMTFLRQVSLRSAWTNLLGQRA